MRRMPMLVEFFSGLALLTLCFLAGLAWHHPRGYLYMYAIGLSCLVVAGYRIWVVWSIDSHRKHDVSLSPKIKGKRYETHD